MTNYLLLKRSSSCPIDSKSSLLSVNQEHFSKRWEMSPDSIFLFPQSPGYQKRRSKQHSDGKKRVSFRQEPSQRIRSLRTNRDLPETWYSRVEIKGFYMDKRRTLKTLKKAHGTISLMDEETFCLRGLERCQSSSMERLLQTQRKCLLESILEEQDKQRRLCVNDQQGFLQVSFHQSKRAVERALTLAALDAAFVFENWNEVSKSWSDPCCNQTNDQKGTRPPGESNDIDYLTEAINKALHISNSPRAA